MQQIYSSCGFEIWLVYNDVNSLSLGYRWGSSVNYILFNKKWHWHWKKLAILLQTQGTIVKMASVIPSYRYCCTFRTAGTWANSLMAKTLAGKGAQERVTWRQWPCETISINWLLLNLYIKGYKVKANIIFLCKWYNPLPNREMNNCWYAQVDQHMNDLQTSMLIVEL